MKVIIKYVDYHWDNHQGGSGKSFELRFIYDVPSEMRAADIIDRATKALLEHVKEVRPYQQKYLPDDNDSPFSIQSMEII